MAVSVPINIADADSLSKNQWEKVQKDRCAGEVTSSRQALLVGGAERKRSILQTRVLGSCVIFNPRQ